MNYATTCPACGAQLVPHVGPAQNTPWLCNNCHHGWWRSELTPQARKLFRPHHGDFGHHPAPGVADEVREARARGHSVHPDMEKLPGVADALRALGRGR